MVATTAQVLRRPVSEGAHRATTGQVLLGQAKFAAIAYPALMSLAFVGAIGAAYFNPRLLEPVEIDRPAQSQPAVQQQPVLLAPQPSTVPARPAPRSEREPLVSRYENGREVGAVSAASQGGLTTATMSNASGDSIRMVQGQVEVCRDQVSPLGQVVGRTCTRHDAVPDSLQRAPR